MPVYKVPGVKEALEKAYSAGMDLAEGQRAELVVVSRTVGGADVSKVEGGVLS